MRHLLDHPLGECGHFHLTSCEVAYVKCSHPKDRATSYSASLSLATPTPGVWDRVVSVETAASTLTTRSVVQGKGPHIEY